MIPCVVFMTFCLLSHLEDPIGDFPPELQKVLSVEPIKKLFIAKKPSLLTQNKTSIGKVYVA